MYCALALYSYLFIPNYNVHSERSSYQGLTVWPIHIEEHSLFVLFSAEALASVSIHRLNVQFVFEVE